MPQYFPFPPLGSCTAFRMNEIISFILYLPQSSDLSKDMVVEVWNDFYAKFNNGDWSAFPLELDTSPKNFFSQNPQKRSFVVYRGSISPSNKGNSLLSPGTYEFCFRIKNKKQKEWSWLGPEGIGEKGMNGTILLHNEVITDIPFPRELFNNLPQEMSNRASSSLDNFKWQRVSFTIPSSSKGEVSNVVVCSLKDSFSRIIRLESPNGWWIEPQFGFKNENIISENFDTQFFLAQNSTGSYILIIPITTQTCWTTLRSQEEKLVMRFINETGDKQTVDLSISIGKDPFFLIEETMKLIITNVLEYELVKKNVLGKTICHKQLGFCTWNAFYREVSEEKIFSSLESFREYNIPIRYFIIDDGWEETTEEETEGKTLLLKSFDPASQKFPEGFDGFLKKIGDSYPQIKVCGIWHPLMGYWEGISPNSKLAESYGPLVYLEKGRIENNSEWLGIAYVVNENNIRKFYTDYYSSLKESGNNKITFSILKIDNQGAFNLYAIQNAEKEAIGPRILYNYHEAFINAAKEKFVSPVIIYCMGLISQNTFNLYSRPPGEGKDLSILRNSDDFFPNKPKSHFLHIQKNAFNGLFTNFFQGITPDWDMFQTGHDWGEFHAAARAICGGPIYITDTPGAHNIEVINKLIAQQRDGDWYILRSQNSPLPTLDSLFDPKVILCSPLKIFNFHLTKGEEGKNKDEWGILGAWGPQINEDEVAITNFSLKDVNYISNTKKKYAVYFMSSRFAEQVNSIDEIFPILIPVKGCEIATFAPLKILKIKNSEVKVGCFGLIDKYNCSQPICDVMIIENYFNSFSYQAELNAISEKCGFYLSVNSPTTQCKLSAKIDGKLISEEKIEQEIGSDLVTVNFMEKASFQEVETGDKMENFIVVLKVDFCG